MENEVNKQNEPITINRFEAKTEAKIINALDKIFIQTNNTSEDQAVNNGSCIAVDPSHICMCIAKSEEAKRVISRFVDKDKDTKIPNLVFKDVGNSNFSNDYITKVINVLKVRCDFINFKVGSDQPGIISNEDFEFWLAPRIEQD